MTYKDIQFVETKVFTRQVVEYPGDAEYLALQQCLAINPAAGVVIRGSGGLRKYRWGLNGRGKSGGIRVIYFVDYETATIFMLYLYPKNVADDLTAEQAARLARLVERELI